MLKLKDPGSTLAKAQRIDVSKPVQFTNRIGGTDLLDTYRFRLSSSTKVDLKLQGLKRNADMALLDSKGRVLEIAARPGKRDEVLSKTLGKGTYFIQVLGRGRSTAYQLKMTAVPPNSGGNGGNGSDNGGGNGGGSNPNSSPTLSRNTEFIVTRASMKALSSDQLLFTDKEQAGDRLVYTVTKGTQSGKLQLNGNVLGVGDRFTQNDIDKGAVTYLGRPSPTKIAENLKGVKNLQRSGDNFIWTTLDTNTYSLFYKQGDGTAVKLQESSIDPKAALSGNKVVWEGKDLAGTDNEIFFFDGSSQTGTTPNIQNLTNDNLRNANAKISGNNIIWETEDPQGEGAADDVVKLLYKSGASAVKEIVSVRLTNIVLDSQKTLRSQIDGTGIVWEEKVSDGSSQSPSQIFFRDGATLAPKVQISNSQFGNQAAQISGNKIVWNTAKLEPPKPGAFLNLNPEIGLRDRTSESGDITNLSQDLGRDTSPIISGSTVVWVNGSEANVTSLIYSANGTKSVAATDLKKLNAIALSGNTLVWAGTSETGNADLFSYDGQMVTRLTSSLAEERSVSLDGSKLFWDSKTGDTVTLYASDLTDGLANGGFSIDEQDSFDFTVTDGAGGTSGGTLQIKLS